MCDDCRTLAAEHILDYVNLGLHLDVAIRLERDAVVQHALRDRAGQDAIDVALELSDTIVEVGEDLEIVQAEMPDYWACALTARRIEKNAP